VRAAISGFPTSRLDPSKGVVIHGDTSSRRFTEMDAPPPPRPPPPPQDQPPPPHETGTPRAPTAPQKKKQPPCKKCVCVKPGNARF